MFLLAGISNASFPLGRRFGYDFREHRPAPIGARPVGQRSARSARGVTCRAQGPARSRYAARVNRLTKADMRWRRSSLRALASVVM